MSSRMQDNLYNEVEFRGHINIEVLIPWKFRQYTAMKKSSDFNFHWDTINSTVCNVRVEDLLLLETVKYHLS